MATVEGEDVQFGNGYHAKLYNILPHPTDKHKSICEIKPTSLTIKAYGLDPADSERDRVTGFYRKEYLKDYIIEHNLGRNGRSYTFLCDWEGKETDFVEKVNIVHLSTISFLRAENKLLKLQRTQLFREAQEMMLQPELFKEQFFRKWLKLFPQETQQQSQIPASDGGF